LRFQTSPLRLQPTVRRGKFLRPLLRGPPPFFKVAQMAAGAGNRESLRP